MKTNDITAEILKQTEDGYVKRQGVVATDIPESDVRDFFYNEISEWVEVALQQLKEEIKKELRMEKLYNPKVSSIAESQLPTERYEDYDERKRLIYTDKDMKYAYNQAVDEFNKKLDEL